MKKTKLLYIEDNKFDQKDFKRFIKNFSNEFDYTIIDSVGKAKENLEKETYDVVVVDYTLGDGTAMDILELGLSAPVIIITGTGSEEIAVKAMKAGAKDYLIKDMESNYLKILPLTIERALKQKQTDKDLAKHIEALARSNAELEQFAYVASHDLQEPLRMVTNFLQLLEKRLEDKMDTDSKEFINYAVEGAKRMKHMIDDLLSYSRVLSKKAQFEEIDVDIILDQVMEDLMENINENKAKIIRKKMPMLVADKIKLARIFINLINNAIKFRNKNAAPLIEISCEETKQDYVFSVRDNGLGLKKEYQEKIFIIFQRLNPKEEYPGSGIGLAVCKKIAELHDGKIWVESELGAGSTFYFSISRQLLKNSP